MTFRVMSFVHQLRILISIVHFLAEYRELDTLEIFRFPQSLSFNLWSRFLKIMESWVQGTFNSNSIA